MRLPHTVFLGLCPQGKQQKMKHKLKLKLVIVLSASMLLNVFLMWELKRKTDYSKKLEERIKETLPE